MATRTREKAAAHKANDDKRPRAIAKYIRISPRKVQVVIDLIRGKKVDEALAILAYTPKSASPVVEKLLGSAIANAENNHNLDVDSLIVAEAWVGKNLVMKRGRPRARGRYGKIMKPFSEITIKVRQVEAVEAGERA